MPGIDLELEEGGWAGGLEEPIDGWPAQPPWPDAENLPRRRRLIRTRDNGRTQVQPDVPGVTVQQRRAAGYQAQLQGTLVVDEITNCLVVRKGTIQVWQIDVAWPQGWSVAVRDSTIRLGRSGRTDVRQGR